MNGARRLHARLAWIAGAVAMLWASTGLLHPVMTWTAPRPATQTPPQMTVSTAGVIAPAAALGAAGIEEADFVRLLDVKGEEIWLARTGDVIDAAPASYGVDARAALSRHVEMLARHYADERQAPLISMREVRSFSLEYPSVNRYLPVWRVALDTPSGIAIYVEPMTGRLAAVTDKRRRAFLYVFQTVHTLSFLDGVEPLRKVVVFALVGTLLATSLAGMAMALRPGARKGARRAHRLLAIAASPLAMMFAVTGLFHVVAGDTPDTPPPKAFQTTLLEGVPPAQDASSLVVSAGNGAPLWRREATRGVDYFMANGAAANIEEKDVARAIAGGDDGADVSLLSTYTPEYGFAKKRLPVWRVERDGRAVFADTLEGRVAGASKSAVGLAEAWSFDRLHKFGALNGIGRQNRDYVSMACAGLVLLAAGAGLLLAARRGASAVKKR